MTLKDLAHKKLLLAKSLSIAESTTPGSIQDLFLQQAARLDQEIAQYEMSAEGRMNRPKKKKAKSK